MPNTVTKPESATSLNFRSAAIRMEGDGAKKRAVLSTEKPVEMFDWDRGEFIPEVLLSEGMESPNQVPLLDTHDRYSIKSQPGSIRDIRREGGEVTGTLHFASTQDGEDARKKVEEGHVTDMSAGYETTRSGTVYIPPGQEREIGGKRFAGPMNVRTKWKLREASLCPIGADDQAKIRGYKSMEEALRQISSDPNKTTSTDQGGRDADAVDSAGADAGNGGDEGERTETNTEIKPTPFPMSETINQERSDAPRIDVIAERRNAAKAESERQNAIRSIANTFDLHGESESYLIDPDKSVEDFRSFALNKLAERNRPSTTTHDGSEFSKQEKRDLNEFRFTEYLRLSVDPKAKLEGIYAEAHQEAEREARSVGAEIRGYGIPSSFVRYGKRDATATLGSGGDQGGVLVETEVRSIIDVFNSKLIVNQLGATMFTDLVGNIDFPKPTKGSDPSEKAENTAATEYDATWGKVTLSPKRLPSFTEVSKQLIKQTGIGVENWFRNQIGTQIAVRMDKMALNGSGSSSQPQGLIGTSGVGGVTTSGTLTWAKILEFESDVEGADALGGSLAWACTPAVKAEAKGTVKESGQASYLMEGNEMNGYMVYSSTVVPAQHLIFGNWNDLYIGMWGGIDVQANPYIKDTEGLVRITFETFYDAAVARAESFSIATDV